MVPAAASAPPGHRPAPALWPAAVRSGSGSRHVLLARVFFSATWPAAQWSAARRVVVERCDAGMVGSRWVRHRERGARASLTWPFSSLSPGWRPRRRGAIALCAPFPPRGGPHSLASRWNLRRLGDTTPTIKARLAWSRFGVFPFHPALLRRAPGMCDTQTHRYTDRYTSQNLN